MLGQNNIEKNDIIIRFCKENNIRKVFILSPKQYYFECSFENHEFIEYENIIMYVYFYRLLQKINNDTLIVINECLRTQNRYDLTYNCIRNFLNQTHHQLIFQYFPFIETINDFFTLFDFDTRSKWKGQTDTGLLKNSIIHVKQIDIKFNQINIETDSRTKTKYIKEKERLIENIGLKDPHTIPRNLYLISGKTKLALIDKSKQYIGRNNRFSLNNIRTYKELRYHGEHTVFELCHNFINFIDFLSLSRQTNIDVLVSDLKVDQWYFYRYQNWISNMGEVYAKIRQ